VCLRGLSVSKQSISALLCRLVQSTTILLSAAARTVIANSSATGDVDALLDKQPSRRLTILQVPLKHGQVGHHAPSSFIQGRPFPKTAPWHIYKNRAGKRQDLPPYKQRIHEPLTTQTRTQRGHRLAKSKRVLGGQGSQCRARRARHT
jgi:hypothetical protein